MNLAKFTAKDFDRGRSSVVEMVWILVHAILFTSLNPFNGTRAIALRAFGATVGRGVVIKPRVRVKFPWRLQVGDYSWIGEGVWIDNLADVWIGSHSCISQDAYLCTGNHDWKSEGFDLRVGPIRIGREVWVAAKVVIGPGVELGDRSIVTLGTVITKSIPAGSFCSVASADIVTNAR